MIALSIVGYLLLGILLGAVLRRVTVKDLDYAELILPILFWPMLLVIFALVGLGKLACLLGDWRAS